MQGEIIVPNSSLQIISAKANADKNNMYIKIA